MTYQVKLTPDITVAHLDIEKVTWRGRKTYLSFTNTQLWLVHLWDGRVIEVKPSELDSASEEVLKDIAFPG
ncbi:hypothetical protein DSM106972_009210 [Dulcicalothrix desertica PCC 7102]|uniref:Uncharacterized protein n=1 Tax=Dulcicalothrix desertica PCC 7102 TaxID=232991 RepID=A0A3S1ATR1_9CYAN|nr:hypothetical protein [Dulcicalothrix desertica]RUT08868.1 hypothetical protein DSM106972_009210 [Dulcicalothrix desertica PCC 7102]TWH44116.1 hypothetical protein CAL7102_07894 [Dulcicalothrix desertica PCC 7102]